MMKFVWCRGVSTLVLLVCGILAVLHSAQAFAPLPLLVRNEAASKAVCSPNGGRSVLKLQLQRDGSKTDLSSSTVLKESTPDLKIKDIVGDMTHTIDDAKHNVEEEFLKRVDDVSSRLEDAKLVIEDAKHNVESAADEMFKRFDSFRQQISKEEDNAKEAFARFDAFLKGDNKTHDSKDK